MSLCFMIVFLALASGWPQGAPARQQEAVPATPLVEKSEKQFAFYPGGKLEVNAAAPGSVIVTGWPEAQVRVEMEKIFYYLTPEQAQLIGKQYPVKVNWTPTEAKITTTGNKEPSARMEVNLRIFVPQDRTDLSLNIIKGDLSVSSMLGWIEATMEEGNLEAKDLAGYFSGKITRGDIRVGFTGKRWTGYGFAAATKKGSVHVNIPADYAAALQFETKDGGISLDYPDQMVDGESVPLQVVAKKKACALKAPINGGGAPIKLATVSGNIVFTSNR